MLLRLRGQKLIAAMPRERVLTESDGPFAQLGGHVLMPWDVPATYPILARLWGTDVDSVVLQLKSNLRALGALIGTA